MPRPLSVLTLLLLTLPTACSSPTALLQDGAELDDASLALIVGRAEFDDDWRPTDEVTTYGIEGTVGADDGMALEWGLSRGNQSANALPNADLDVTHNRAWVGTRYTWNADGFYPYVGLGVEATATEVRFLGRDDTDTEPGAYVHVGFRVDLNSSRTLFFGIDARAGGFGSEHTHRLGGFTIQNDSDYVQGLATLGLRF